MKRATIVAMLALLTGCGGGTSGPELHPVSGTVTYKNAPVKNATLTLVAKGAPAVNAKTGEDGSFTLRTGAEEGAPVGDYKVAVIAVSGGSATDVTPDSPEYEKMMKGEVPKETWLVPQKYGNTETSGLTISVKPGGSEDVKLELKD